MIANFIFKALPNNDLKIHSPAAVKKHLENSFYWGARCIIEAFSHEILKKIAEHGNRLCRELESCLIYKSEPKIVLCKISCAFPELSVLSAAIYQLSKGSSLWKHASAPRSTSICRQALRAPLLPGSRAMMYGLLRGGAPHT